MVLQIKNTRTTFVAYDGRPNPNKPYDRLSSAERHARIRTVLARIALRNADKLCIPNGDDRVSAEPTEP